MILVDLYCPKNTFNYFNNVILLLFIYSWIDSFTMFLCSKRYLLNAYASKIWKITIITLKLYQENGALKCTISPKYPISI